MNIRCVVFSVVMLCSSVLYADDTWKTRVQEGGISVYTRKVEGAPILEFKSDVVVNAPLDKVIALFEDEKQTPSWYYQCIRMDLVEAASATDKIFYFVINLPWPVAKRDSVFRRVKTTDAATGAVTYEFSALPERLPKVKGKIRVPYLKGAWRFTPKEGKTEVYFQQHSDAGGSLPPFLTNALVVDIPLNSLKSFRALVEKSGS
jgi:hypothetical protein